MTQTGSMKVAWQGALAILLLTLVVYWPAYFASFHWDDAQLILAQPLITQPGGLAKIWFSTEPVDYIPLTSTMFWIEYRLFGDNPLPYHVVNVVLHALGAVLLWLVLQRLAVPGAWLGAAVFAVHPVTVSSAAWIAEGKNTLAMVLAMAALWSFLKSNGLAPSAPASRLSARWYAVSLMLFLLALLAKAAVVMLAPTLLVLIWWKQRAVRWADVRRVAPYFFLSLFLGLITVWFQSYRSIGDLDTRPEGWVSRIAGVGWCAWFYLGKALLPTQLMMVYPRWEIPGSAVALLPLMGLLVLGGWLVAARNHLLGGRGIVTGLAIYALHLLPVLGLVKMSWFQYSLVADHFQYFSLPALTALLAAAAWTAADRWRIDRRGRQWAAGAVVVVVGAMTFSQTRLYESYETLWTDVMVKNPGSGVAYYLRGWGRLEAGQFAAAEQDFRRAVELKLAQPELFTRLAGLVESRGNSGEAIELLQTAAERFPRDVRVLNNLGSMLVRSNRLPEALAAYDRVLALEPQAAELTYSRAYVLARLGQRDEAILGMQRAIELDPQHARAVTVLGMLFIDKGDLLQAQRALQRAHQLDPQSLPVLLNLARLYLQQGQFASAYTMASQAQRLAPDDPTAREILARLRPGASPGPGR